MVHSQSIADAQPYHLDIFTQGAFVSAKTTPLSIKQGVNYFQITGLPSDFAIKNAIFNLGSGAFIISAQVQIDTFSYKNDLEIKSIEKRLRKAIDSLADINFSEQKLRYIKAILQENSKIEVSDKSIYIDDLDELLVFYRNKLRVLNRENNIIGRHKKIIVHQIDSLKMAKNERITTLGYPRALLMLQISSEIETTESLEMFYNTDLANWNPRYALVCGTDDKSTLVMNAMVNQNLGFNLTQVSIGLSCGGKKQSIKSVNFPNTTFSIPGKYNISNKGTLAINGVFADKIKTDFYYSCNPNNNFLANQVLKIKDLSGSFYAKGLMNIQTSSGNQIVDSFGSSLFNDSVNCVLSFSNDIKCYKTLEKEKLRKSIIGNKENSIVEWQLEVTNKTEKTQKVIIEDYLPFFSGNSSVTIELNIPNGAVKTDNTFTYTISLQPGETKKINYGFQISAPKGTQIKDYYQY